MSLVAIDWFFRLVFTNVFVLSDKQTEDQSKSPSAVANVDLISLEPSQ